MNGNPTKPPTFAYHPATPLKMNHWKEENGALRRDFTTTDFTTAFAFMTEVAFAAEAANHHPEWSNVYNRVSIKLTTHDAGNTVTDKDRNLATRIDEIYTRYA